MATVIDVGTLDAQGFLIEGGAAGDAAGFSVSSAGDINGDGIDDFIIGAPVSSEPFGAAGQAYVIFGRGSGFNTVDLGNLSASQGFAIQGNEVYSYAGFSVSSAGDVNGDGFDDVIVGAANGSFYYGGSDQAYVIFGKADGFGTIDLGSLAPSDGFSMEGQYSYGGGGPSVSSAGDINGDGFDDVIVGSPYFAEAYVIFGHAGPFDNIDLATIAPADGFTIIGGSYGEGPGGSVSSAGDVNGDGFDDILVGVPQDDTGGTDAGASYVIFGKATGFGTIDLGNLAPSAGFAIVGDSAGDYAGISVSEAGDVNGDGFADLVIGAYGGDDGGADAGEAYVIFGRADGFTTVNLSSLPSYRGFVIRGDTTEDFAGFSVSGAGDVNGDGFDDLIVGAKYGDDGGADAGEAYVIFGKVGGFGTIDLTALAPADGFIIRGDEAGDLAGFSVSAAGDVNHDGFDDVIVGAPSATGDAGSSGEAYVIYGSAPTTSVTRIGSVIGQTIRGGSANDHLEGRAGDDLLYGAEGSDKLLGGSGNDVLNGGAGNDVLSGGIDSDVMRGGLDDDTYYVDNASDRIIEYGGQGTDLVYSSISHSLHSNVEDLSLTGTAIRATGNSLANRLVGNSADNILDGAAGADVMRGGLGDDTYYVDNVGDKVVENAGAGRDRVYSTISLSLRSNLEDLFLRGSASINATGNSLDNVLGGNAAANVLTGGAGADDLRGGGGADKFVFRDGDFGGLTPSTSDRIIDFSHAEGDRIDLHLVDASSTLDGNQHFTFIGSDSFHNVAGELRYQQINGNTYVYGDTDGDGAADFLIRLDGSHSLTGSDFLV